MDRGGRVSNTPIPKYSSDELQKARAPSTGIWRRVVRWVSTDVSEEHIASICRVEKISWERNERKSRSEELCSSETSVDSQRTTCRYLPEDGTLHTHRCENLKSYIQKATPSNHCGRGFESESKNGCLSQFWRAVLWRWIVFPCE
jgi:hypothetical protein